MTAVISALKYGLFVLLFTYNDDVLPKYITQEEIFFLKVIFIANPHTHPPPSPYPLPQHVCTPQTLSATAQSSDSPPAQLFTSQRIFLRQPLNNTATTPHPNLTYYS